MNEAPDTARHNLSNKDVYQFSLREIKLNYAA